MWLLCLFFRKIQKAQKIFVYNDAICRPVDNLAIVKNINRLKSAIRFLSSRTLVETIGHDEAPEVFYKSNDSLLKFLESSKPEFSDCALADLFNSYYSKDGVDRSVCLFLVNRIRPVWYLRNILKVITARHDRVTLFCTIVDEFKILDDEIIHEPKFIIYFKSLALLMQNVRIALIFFGGMLAGFRRITLKNPSPKNIRFAAQSPYLELWSECPNQKPQHWSSRFIEDGELSNLRNVLYVHGIWDSNYSPSVLDRMKNFLDTNGGHRFDEMAIRYTLRHLFRVHLGFWGLKLLLPLLTHLTSGRPLVVAEAYLALSRHISRYTAFLDHWRPSSFIGFDDQSISSIARTLVFGANGIANVGMIHSTLGGKWHHPIFAFSYFHKLLLYSTINEESYGEYWGNMKRAVVGPLRSDLLYDQKVNRYKKDLYRKTYGDKKSVLLIVVTAPINNTTRINAFHQALKDAALKFPDLVFILRPLLDSKGKAVYHFPDHIKDLEDAVLSGSVRIDTNDFSTYELMAEADVIVSTDTSSGMLEGMLLDKPTFYFAWQRFEKFNAFSKRDKRFHAYDSETFIDRITFYLYEKEGRDLCAKVAREISPPLDGRFSTRVCQEMDATAQGLS